MIRVLIADDSPTARRLLTEILSSDPELEVVGEAANGQEAVRMTVQLEPDVLTMDIHMPVMDGFEATEEIMKSVPTPIVIVSSSTMVQEVTATMKALCAGALTLLLKPPGPAVPEFATASRELIEMVKAMADVKVVRRSRGPMPAAPPPKVDASPTNRRAIGIAASTGGPPAVQAILSRLPQDFPMPILVVQHIAHGFTDGLVAWLDSSTGLQVKLAKRGETLEPSTVYIAPEDFHLGVSRNSIVELSKSDPIERFRPSATYLFRSMAESLKANSIGVILTGMGVDGVAGLKQLRKAGGIVLAQNSESSVVFGMPGAALEAGIVDCSASPEELADALLKLVQQK